MLDRDSWPVTRVYGSVSPEDPVSEPIPVRVVAVHRDGGAELAATHAAPDGQFVFFEHVRAHSRFGAAIQSGLTPIYRRLAGGCHLNRDTQAATEAAGFDTTVRRMKIGALPVIVGVAHKRP